MARINGPEQQRRLPRAASLFALVALGALGAACGDDDAATPRTTPPADSSPTSDGASPAELTIRYSHPPEDVTFEYGVACPGDGSSGEVTGDAERAEVEASAACAALAEPEVVQRLVQGPDDEICTEIYGGPDVAEISGSIGDESVEATIDRVDGCAIDDWDELLSDLLPSAIGVGPTTTA